MLSKIVYLVTGANRGLPLFNPFFRHITCLASDLLPGIGLGLVASLLLRPNTVVVATVRSDTTPTDELRGHSLAEGSQLVVLTLSSVSDKSAASLVANLPAFGITHIDTVIANAGSGVSFQPTLATSLLSLRNDFEVNTLGPVKLFQATYPLLKESPKPKFVLISSALGSIGYMDESPNLSYGVSKVAANFLIKKVHLEHNDIASLAVHPG
jgi:norsolorinic acid ketoreductase